MLDDYIDQYAVEVRIILNTNDPNIAAERSEEIDKAIQGVLDGFDGEWVSSEIYTF